MLLGGISFVMTLFYLVNDEDPDMRFYSWRVISATLSIFSAVLIFSGINKLKLGAWQVIHFYLLPQSQTPGYQFLLALVPMLTYFLLLQLGTAYESSALATAAPLALGDRELEELCDLWSPAHSLRHLARRQENVIDAEHDAAALSVSFLVVQSCRFAFSGRLAHDMAPGHSAKPQKTIESPWALRFAAFSLVFAALSVVLVVLGRRIFKGLLAVWEVTPWVQKHI
eukprot:Skav221961  [mRNA]  locus=scaffold195:719456:724597:- [translate_table: standard]